MPTLRSQFFLVALFFSVYACDQEPPPAPEVNTGDTVAHYDKSVPVATHDLGKPWLSDYGFFTGDLRELRPAEQVLPYALNAPLFSDYTTKDRFVYFPEGTTADYREQAVFDFPEGTVIIKNFSYLDHQGDTPERRLLETRLLVKTAVAWQPLSYVWDEAQTDARFSILGAALPVSWTEATGEERAFTYRVPDLNQCKSCHAYAGETHPIGPSARQLNGNFAYAGGADNQLDYWAAHGLLTGLPPAPRPRLAAYAQADRYPLNDRALAYLDANCGHCHRPEGSAKTSGLDLTVFETDRYRRGLNKPPVAAGKASGNLQYSIVAGSPETSILLYRMAHTDPEIAMPELGRQLVHVEGVALIREWIKEMEAK